MYSPLEQFDIIFYMTDNLILINSLLILSYIFIFILIIYFYGAKKESSINKLGVVIYEFVIEIINQQLSLKEIKYFPLIGIIFLMILISNVFGMLPFGFTITAHLSITFFLALSVALSLLLIGFLENGIDFLKLFVPSGTPSFLLPLIVVIEIVSYLIRPFSLSIRLFANMMAGHCLIFVISSFVFSLFAKSFMLTILPVSLIFLGIFILEFAICFLQSYVFIILICIYLNEAIHPIH